MSKGKRTVTFVLEFDQKDRPQWLWDAHFTPVNGVKTIGIAEGNSIAELEEKELEEIEEDQ